MWFTKDHPEISCAGLNGLDGRIHNLAAIAFATEGWGRARLPCGHAKYPTLVKAQASARWAT